ncbi:hypothetical protein [Pseudomonas sp. Gutcm_11s]|uniref:hypothetical protein n=1 Tax=Pseudomonas sp. Gutcm_11s TaxID=3026088 RepID=UPI002362C325|nr:hypothetical protein [Pseudomonas sp. Gutcm_11s]MDD0844615.1 hypothetical protein [Pseudomonas sp. Gutcm_11s]
MVTEPVIYSDYKHHYGYDVAVEVTGPIKSNPVDPSDNRSHYVAKYSIYFNGEELLDSEVWLQQHFQTKDAAMLEAFVLGRHAADLLR